MSNRNFVIKPPYPECGPDNPYRVVYVIDVVAANPKEAARQVDLIMKNKEAIPPLLHIIDCQGRVTDIDLSQDR